MTGVMERGRANSDRMELRTGAPGLDEVRRGFGGEETN